MKTLKNPLFLLVLVFGLFAVGCSDDDKDNNNNNNMWNYSRDAYGNCIDNRTRQQVSFQLCQQQQQIGQVPGQPWGQQPGWNQQQGWNQQPGWNQQQGWNQQYQYQYQYEYCSGQYRSFNGQTVWCSAGTWGGGGSSCSGQQLYNQWNQMVICQ